MNAKERAARIAGLFLDYPESSVDLPEVIRHLEEYRREGMEATRQACGGSAWNAAADRDLRASDARAVRAAVLATPLPGETP